MTYPSGTVLNYNYGSANGTNDVISRLDNLSETNGNVTTTLESYSYLGLGTVVKRAHPEDGVDLTYIKKIGESNGDAGDQYIGLDRFGRVVDQRWINGGGTDLDRYQYAYDRDGNITSKTNTLHTAFNEAYTYDGLNRLTATDRNNGTTNDQSWSLDALGNMNSVTTNGTTATRSFNDQNQLLDIDVLAPGTLAFDANGNTITDDHGDGLIYDAWNRLKQVSNGNSTLMAYSYDGKGWQVSETDANSTKTDQYFSSSWQTVEQRISVSYGNAGSVSAQYVFSPVYVDAIVLRDRDTDANGTLDQRIYVMQDANQNVTGLLSTAGPVLQRYVYDSYGQFAVKDSGWSSTNESYAWNRNHQGLEYDAVIGWYMNRNRTYSSTMMRFGEEDPMGYVNGLNEYVFAGDNPLNRQDSQGTDFTNNTNETVWVYQSGIPTPWFPVTPGASAYGDIDFIWLPSARYFDKPAFKWIDCFDVVLDASGIHTEFVRFQGNNFKRKCACGSEWLADALQLRNGGYKDPISEGIGAPPGWSWNSGTMTWERR